MSHLELSGINPTYKVSGIGLLVRCNASQYGERFLTQEEVEEFADVAAADAGSDAALNIEGVDGSYNDFGLKSGYRRQCEDVYIVYPENGRLPEVQEGVVEQQGVYGGLLLVNATGQNSCGWNWCRWTRRSWFIRRCIIGFNAGPPFVPSLTTIMCRYFRVKIQSFC